MEVIANAEEPPPEGSTASKKCLVLVSWSLFMRFWCSLSRRRARKASTSAEGKALLEASAEMPRDSRRSMACGQGGL
jgi:hypothetical protein